MGATFYSDATAATWATWTTTMTTTAYSMGANQVWYVWANGATTATTANAWTNWTTTNITGGTITVSQAVDARTPEQRASNDARWAAEHAETARRAADAAAVRTAALDKARRLLLSMLAQQQREQLERQRFFEVVARHSGRRYRIREGTHGNVRLLNSEGHEIQSYCGQPNGVPVWDSMLAQKLQIEHDEPAFLKVANARNM